MGKAIELQRVFDEDSPTKQDIRDAVKELATRSELDEVKAHLREVKDDLKVVKGDVAQVLDILTGQRP